MLHISSDLSKVDCIHKARSLLDSYLRECNDREEDLLFCLSGGSALDLLKGFDYSLLSKRVTITVLDERFSTNSEINNFAQIEKAGFISLAKTAGCQIIDTKPKEGETIEAMTTRFNASLVSWIENHSHGKIVATAGMGPDGHTSGIIPESDGFEDLFANNTGLLAVGYKAANQPEDHDLRVTTTFNFLRMIAFAVLVVTGDKQEAMDQLLSDKGSLSDTPARIWKDVGGEIHLFTDLVV